MRHLIALCMLLVVPATASHAETRGTPWSEEKLFEVSKEVFVGQVLETKTFDRHKRTVPTRARVLLSIKGNLPRGDRAVLPKDPGRFVYFDEEFSHADKGQLGIFYVGRKDQPKLLMGYRHINTQ